MEWIKAWNIFKRDCLSPTGVMFWNFLQKKIGSPNLQDRRRWPYMEIGSLQRKLKQGQQGRRHSKDCCPYRGNLDRETHMEGRLEWGIYKLDCLKIAAHYKTQGGREEDGFQRERSPVHILISDLPPTTVTQEISVAWNPPSLWHFGQP